VELEKAQPERVRSKWGNPKGLFEKLKLSSKNLVFDSAPQTIFLAMTPSEI
jgi:hypothetical protein